MIPTITVIVLITLFFIFYKKYSNELKQEERQRKRLIELHDAEQRLQYLKDKKQVANVDLTAAELETKIEKLKRKINKENKKHDSTDPQV